MKKLDKMLSKAKVGILFAHKSHYTQEIMYGLRWGFDKDLPTAGTNGTDVKINPEFFVKQSEPQRIGLLAHEIWHVALEHMTRGEGKDPEIYNQAADHVINLFLLAQGYSLPEGRLANPQFKGMSTDEVYKKLIENPKLQMPKTQFAKLGDLQPPKTKEELKKVQEKVEDLLVRASIVAAKAGEKAGSMPGELKVKLDELCNPQLPWNVILQNYYLAKVQEDSTFTRPNRRYFPDYYMPTLTGEGLAKVVCCIDSSGSVHDKEFDQYWAEIKAIKERLNPEKLTIINFDTKIKNIYEYTRDEQIGDVNFTGRGGTSLTPAMDKVREINPEIAIFFSDLHCSAVPLSQKPKQDVIWIAVNHPEAKVNFGTLIHAKVSV